MSELEKTFNPADVDERWAARWKESEAFACGNSKEDPFCIMMPPPNVTGSLHMGHALNHSIQDILTRYHRMRNFDTLWQPGTDHAGIATQMVVERQLEEEGKTRHDLGREAFIERVWDWREHSGGMILNQLQRLGASADWPRERFTMDEGLSAAVRKVFVQLHKEGLIYRDKRLVNWDTQLHTAISDLEVEPREVNGHLWYFKYPLEDDPSRFITVATTRPETMIGDTAVAVHPEDERYKDLVGKNVILPIVNRPIPIVADEYSDPEKGSGAVKITPAHDFNDFEVGKRQGLERINILDGNGSMNKNCPAAYQGLDRFAARKKVVAEFEALGLLEKIEDELHTVPFGDRSGTVIEPWLTDQWFVDAPELAKEAIRAVEDGETRFVPENWTKTYFEWMRNIQPWCISRQIWWGHRVPAWYGPDQYIFVEETEEEAHAQAEEHYGAPVELRRDDDVLDTWFSSGLWPFSTLGWPEKTSELKRYYPTSVLVTGFDIIFFWVARMMMMGMHFMKEAPFKTVYIHALVRDEKGQKMSKSKGNVMDPLELVDKYGADALRFTLAAMAAPGRDIKLSEKRVEGYRNFATKIWNACRFVRMQEGEVDLDNLDLDSAPSADSADDAYILARLSDAILAVHRQFDAYRFDEVAHTLYDFTWHSFCDWHLEAIKPVLQSEDSERRRETLENLYYVMGNILRLLHPIMPFLTEELWEGIGFSRTRGMLVTGRIPEAFGTAATEEELDYVEGKRELVNLARSLRSDYGIAPSTRAPYIVRPRDAATAERLEIDAAALSGLLRAESLSIDLSFEPESATPGGVSSLGAVFLPLGDLIDLDQERKKIEGQLAEARKFMTGIEKKLSNEKFVQNAPDEVVQQQRDRLEEVRERAGKLQAMIETLG